jgi:hypothetical protein
MISKDILWKGIIEDLFEDFLWYCLPALAKTAVDFTQPFEFLDKELDALAVESERGKRHADKLVKFYLKSGQACYALLHVEKAITTQILPNGCLSIITAFRISGTCLYAPLYSTQTRLQAITLRNM